jgi:serine/threonine protein phosphatase PrpC
MNFNSMTTIHEQQISNMTSGLKVIIPTTEEEDLSMTEPTTPVELEESVEQKDESGTTSDSWIGTRYMEQQDSMFYQERTSYNGVEYAYWIVCDGHGSPGAFVSNYIKETFSTTFQRHLELFPFEDAIKNCVDGLHDQVVQHVTALGRRLIVNSSGTTFTGLFVNFTTGEAFTANVGDSRVAITVNGSDELFSDSFTLTTNHDIHHKEDMEALSDLCFTSGFYIKQRIFDDASIIEQLDKMRQELGRKLTYDEVTAIGSSSERYQALGIQMTRAIGDCAYPFLKHHCDVVKVKVRKADTVRFVVASDGFWDYYDLIKESDPNALSVLKQAPLNAEAVLKLVMKFYEEYRSTRDPWLRWDNTSVICGKFVL